MDSSAHPVELDLTVLDVWDADVKSESFSAKLKVRLRWVCPSDHADEAMNEGGDGLDTDWEPEWYPRISIDSATSTDVEHTFFVADRDQDGVVRITGDWTLNAHILEAYDLHAFPFDIQDFNIVVRLENAAMRLELRALPDVVKRGSPERSRSRHKPPIKAKAAKTQATLEVPEGTPVRVEAAGLELPDFRTLRDRDDGSNWLERPALYRTLPQNNEVHVVLLYERNPLFYVLNFMLLLCGITSCAAFGWAVPWQTVADRLALDVTLLLTSIAFKQVLAGTVPPISYLTRLDAYALGSLSFLLLGTAMHAAIGFMIDYCDDNGVCSFDIANFGNVNARDLDNAFLYSWLGLWLAANVFYAYSVYRRLKQGRRNYSLANAKAHKFEAAEVQKLDVKEWWEDDCGAAQAEEKGTSRMLQQSAGI